MKAIHYGVDELITGDAIAAALVQYAQALAVASRAATVNIPVIDADGNTVVANVLLGPSSQIVALPYPTDLDEIVDTAVVADLKKRSAQIGNPVAYPSTAEMAAPNIDLENDW